MKIEVENLRFAYGVKPVLDVKNTTFEAGKFYGIVGQNGTGKTTFFKSLTNIITNYLGEIKIDGENVKKNPAILQKVGITLDDIELYKSQTGWFNIRYFGGLRGGFDQEKVQDFAANLDLIEMLDKKVSTYSLGMKKKLILLISLMNDAELFIFDEPFRGVDQKSVNWLRAHMKSLKSDGKIVLISSHVNADIEELCDHVFLLENGDFTASFDLTDHSQELTYKITVNKFDDMLWLLGEWHIPASYKGEEIRFELTKERFDYLFAEAINRQISFSSIEKTSKFAEKLGGEA